MTEPNVPRSGSPALAAEAPVQPVLKAVVTGLVVLALAACGGGGGATSGQPAGTTRVAMAEYRFTPSTVDVSSGATLYLVNEGNAAHDLVVAGPGGAVKARSSMVPPGGSATFSIGVLTAGDYQVYCDVPGHRDAGMTGKLTVT